MKNTNRQPSSGSVLLGMAAGAALGAVGTMAMAQNQRQVKRTARKLAKGAERAMSSWIPWSRISWSAGWTCEEKQKGRAAGSAFLLAIYFWFQIHIRALVLISPRPAGPSGCCRSQGRICSHRCR